MSHRSWFRQTQAGNHRYDSLNALSKIWLFGILPNKFSSCGLFKEVVVMLLVSPDKGELRYTTFCDRVLRPLAKKGWVYKVLEQHCFSWAHPMNRCTPFALATRFWIWQTKFCIPESRTSMGTLSFVPSGVEGLAPLPQSTAALFEFMWAKFTDMHRQFDAARLRKVGFDAQDEIFYRLAIAGSMRTPCWQLFSRPGTIV